MVEKNNINSSVTQMGLILERIKERSEMLEHSTKWEKHPIIYEIKFLWSKIYWDRIETRRDLTYLRV